MLQKTNTNVLFLTDVKAFMDGWGFQSDSLFRAYAHFCFWGDHGINAERFARMFGLTKPEKAQHNYGCGNMDIPSWDYAILNLGERLSRPKLIERIDAAITRALTAG